jgi:prophage regulatory protein
MQTWNLKMNDIETTNTTERFIRAKEVQAIAGISLSYIYELSKTGRFPKAIELVPGGNALGWLASEVEAWMQERIAKRDQ